MTDTARKSEDDRHQSLPPLMGRFPAKGRQHAYESHVSASLSPRQTPEMFGGVSTD